MSSTVRIKPMWLNDIKSHLPSSWFGSIVCLSGSYFNKAWGENPYSKWPVTRKQKTNRAIIQPHQRNTWKQPALSIWKRLMKHYLQVSGLSRSITTPSYKWFPNHRGNHYTDTLKDKWECCHMQGQSQTSHNLGASSSPGDDCDTSGHSWAKHIRVPSFSFLNLNFSNLVHTAIYQMYV